MPFVTTHYTTQKNDTSERSKGWAFLSSGQVEKLKKTWKRDFSLYLSCLHAFTRGSKFKRDEAAAQCEIPSR